MERRKSKIYVVIRSVLAQGESPTHVIIIVPLLLCVWYVSGAHVMSNSLSLRGL